MLGTHGDSQNVFFSVKFILSQLWPSACNHRSADWWASSSSWHRPLPSFWLPLPPCELFLPKHLKTEGFAKLIPVCLHQSEVTENGKMSMSYCFGFLLTSTRFCRSFSRSLRILCCSARSERRFSCRISHIKTFTIEITLQELMVVFILQNDRANWFDTCLLIQAHSGLYWSLMTY